MLGRPPGEVLPWFPEWRKEHFHTQSKCAEAFDVSGDVISKAERGLSIRLYPFLEARGFAAAEDFRKRYQEQSRGGQKGPLENGKASNETEACQPTRSTKPYENDSKAQTLDLPQVLSAADEVIDQLSRAKSVLFGDWDQQRPMGYLTKRLVDALQYRHCCTCTDSWRRRTEAELYNFRDSQWRKYSQQISAASILAQAVPEAKRLLNLLDGNRDFESKGRSALLSLAIEFESEPSQSPRLARFINQFGPKSDLLRRWDRLMSEIERIKQEARVIDLDLFREITHEVDLFWVDTEEPADFRSTLADALEAAGLDAEFVHEIREVLLPEDLNTLVANAIDWVKEDQQVDLWQQHLQDEQVKQEVRR